MGGFPPSNREEFWNIRDIYWRTQNMALRQDRPVRVTEEALAVLEKE